jgi:hypothetical protein
MKAYLLVTLVVPRQLGLTAVLGFMAIGVWMLVRG